MRQKTNLMTRFCIGSLISVIGFVGCNMTVIDGETPMEYTFIYDNTTQKDITIEKYLKNNKYEDWAIKSNDRLSSVHIPQVEKGEAIYTYDSVRIIFGTKELWYRKHATNEPHSVFCTDNYVYVKTAKYKQEATYTFTKAHLDLATEIKKQTTIHRHVSRHGGVILDLQIAEN